MPRYSAEHKDATRDRILKAAAKEFRSHGYANATVPGIMRTAGLTVGGFYKHFESKAALFAEMFRETLRKSSDRALQLRAITGDEALVPAIAANYLSLEHRDNLRGGCVMAALASDMPRAEPEAKQAFEEELDRYIGTLAEALEGDRQKALALQSLLVGGLILARGMQSPERAKEILEACRQTAETF